MLGLDFSTRVFPRINLAKIKLRLLVVRQCFMNSVTVNAGDLPHSETNSPDLKNSCDLQTPISTSTTFPKAIQT